jgi:hypothetical protein
MLQLHPLTELRCYRNIVEQGVLHILLSFISWTAHSEHQEVWAGPSWSSYALQVRSLLYMGSV